MSGAIAVLFARGGYTGRMLPYAVAGRLTLQAILIWSQTSCFPPSRLPASPCGPWV